MDFLIILFKLSCHLQVIFSFNFFFLVKIASNNKNVNKIYINYKNYPPTDTPSISKHTKSSNIKKNPQRTSENWKNKQKLKQKGSSQKEKQSHPLCGPSSIESANYGTKITKKRNIVYADDQFYYFVEIAEIVAQIKCKRSEKRQKHWKFFAI